MQEERILWYQKTEDESKQAVAELFAKQTENACPVDGLKQIAKEGIIVNCGECVICREGIYQLYVQADAITQGNSSEDDYQIMKDIAQSMSCIANCAFGKYFGKHCAEIFANNEDTFLKHIKRKRCDARVCAKLSDFPEVVQQKEGGLLGGRRRRRTAVE